MGSVFSSPTKTKRKHTEISTTEETTTTNEPPDHNPKSHPETTGTSAVAAVPPIPTNHDLVIRDGFPALFCAPSSQETTTTTNELTSSSSSPPKPNIDDMEHIPLTPFWSTRDDAPLLLVVSSSTPSSSSSLNTKHDSQQQQQQQQQEWWEQIQHDCQVVFDARTRSGSNDDDDEEEEDEENHNIETEYSEGSTYFLPCSMKPRCTLEQMVHSIFQLHTQHLHPSTFVPEQSGAEWWTLVLNAHDDNHDDTNKDHDEEDDDDDDDEVGLHFDADYGLEHQVRNMMIHPRVATVTYMSGNCHSPNIQNNVHHHNTTSTIMAPTTIYNMHSPHSVRNIDDRDPKRALTSSVQPIHTVYISYPQWGKHIAFDGRLLHGAPSTTSVLTKALTQYYQKKQPQATKNQNHSEERPNKKYKSDPSSTTTTTTSTTAKSPVRITLMVNIWLNHCPMDAEPLEDEILDQLITPFDDASKYKNDDDNENTTVSKKPSPPYWNDAVVPYATALAAHNADMTHHLQTKKSKTHKDDDNALIPVTKIDITASSKDVAASTEEMILCHHNVTVTYDTALVEALEEYTTTTAMSNNSNVQLNIKDVNLIQFKVNDEIPDSDEDDDTNDN